MSSNGKIRVKEKNSVGGHKSSNYPGQKMKQQRRKPYFRLTHKEGSEIAQKDNLPDEIFPCKDCVLLVRQRYADKRTEMNDSMDALLIFEVDKVIKREPIRKMSAGCRHCKGYYSYQMSLLNPEEKNVKKGNF